MSTKTVGTTSVNSPAHMQHRSALRWRRLLRRRLLLGVVLGVALVTTLFPLYYVTMAAFNPLGSLGFEGLLPKVMSFDNFVRLFTDPFFPFARWMVNSLIVSVVVAAVTVVLTSMSAYAFSRMRFRGRASLMKSIVIVQVFPNLLALIALYLLVQQSGRVLDALGLDSLWSLVLVYLGGVLGGNVWLMKGYLDSIPRELDESAMIDGASHSRIFFTILLPLARPMLAVVAALSFVATYGEVVLARVLLKANDVLTAPIGLWTLVSGQYTENWGTFAAGAVIVAIPAVIIFYFLQNWLVDGLTQGAVKS